MKSKIDFRVYLITDRHLLPPDSLADRVEKLAQAGLRAVQIREKDLSAREVIGLGLEIRKRTGNYPLRLFINDRADIVRSIEADGLHTPEHGIPVVEARKIIADKIIGKSAHSLEAAFRAEEEGADFITVGPIYDTASKRQYGKPLGIEKFCEIARNISIPVFAIGGITPQRAKECLGAGAYGVSLISNLLCAENPELQMDKYLKVLGSV
jgi:thiamine-phosphate pyrophosphorylase